MSLAVLRSARTYVLAMPTVWVLVGLDAYVPGMPLVCVAEYSGPCPNHVASVGVVYDAHVSLRTQIKSSIIATSIPHFAHPELFQTGSWN